MNICYIASLIHLPHGRDLGSGGSTHTLEVARSLASHGHRVTVVCSRRIGDRRGERLGSFQVRRLFCWDSYLFERLNRQGFYRAARWLRKLSIPFIIYRSLVHYVGLLIVVARGKFDVVYERTSSFTGAGAFVASVFRKPFFVEVNDEQWNPRSLLLSTALITPAKSMMPAEFQNKVKEMDWGVNTELFHPGISGEAIKKQYNLANGPVVIFVGSGMKWHGLGDIIGAAPFILKKHPDCCFLIVSGGPETETHQWRAAREGMGHAFRFAGAVDYELVPSFLAAADIGLAPYTSALAEKSRHRFASPMKVLEYMACGKPTIVSRAGNARGIIEDGVSGLVVPEDSPQILADAVCLLLESREKARQMGAKARAVALERYSWHQHCSRLLEVMQSGK